MRGFPEVTIWAASFGLPPSGKTHSSRPVVSGPLSILVRSVPPLVARYPGFNTQEDGANALPHALTPPPACGMALRAPAKTPTLNPQNGVTLPSVNLLRPSVQRGISPPLGPEVGIEAPALHDILGLKPSSTPIRH